jgi:hypothetical protein
MLSYYTVILYCVCFAIICYKKLHVGRIKHEAIENTTNIELLKFWKTFNAVLKFHYNITLIKI